MKLWSLFLILGLPPSPSRTRNWLLSARSLGEMIKVVYYNCFQICLADLCCIFRVLIRLLHGMQVVDQFLGLLLDILLKRFSIRILATVLIHLTEFNSTPSKSGDEAHPRAVPHHQKKPFRGLHNKRSDFRAVTKSRDAFHIATVAPYSSSPSG